jgi:hypothetical protein
MAATTAFSTVKKFVSAGQEFEQVAGQLGKWYTAVSDFRHAQQEQKKPPIFKKLFNAGSVEEEALNLLIQEKKIMEQEKELSIILNMRFGHGTMDELKEMRRSIRKKREQTVYKQLQRRKAFVELISVSLLLGFCVVMLGGLLYFIAKAKGLI